MMDTVRIVLIFTLLIYLFDIKAQNTISLGAINTHSIAYSDNTQLLSDNVSKPQFIAATEVCNNGIDDDGDGLVDCFDPDCGAETSNLLEVNFPANPQLLSGTTKTAGAVYRFSNVATGIDALVRIEAVSNVTNFSQIFHLGLSQQIRGFPNTNPYVDYAVQFVNSGTYTLITPRDFILSAFDIDGEGDIAKPYSDYVTFKNITSSHVLSTSSNIQTTVLSGNDRQFSERFIGSMYPDDPTGNNPNYGVGVVYTNINSFRVRMGIQGSFSGTNPERTVSIRGSKTGISSFNNITCTQIADTCQLSPTISGKTLICTGQQTTLTASCPANNTCTYLWSNGATTQNITVNPTTSTNYTVTVTRTGLVNSVLNGGFELGNFGFSNEYTYKACGNSSTVIANGEYSIGTSNVQCFAYWGSLPSQQGTRFMYVDAKPPAITGTTPARTLIWEQNVLVLPNTCYNFSSWQRFAVNQVGQDRIPKVEYVVDGNSIGQSQYVTNTWVQAKYSSITGPTQTTVNLKIYAIVEQNGASNITDGNDLAIDNIEFRIPTLTATQNVFVTVVNSPAPTISALSSGFSECVGGTQSLSVTASGGTPPLTYQWQNGGATGATWTNIASATTTTYTPLSTTAGTTQYRVMVISSAGTFCDTLISNSQTVIIVSDPVITVSTAPTTVCVGANLSLTANTSGGMGSCTVQWQSSPNGLTWTNISGATGTTYNITSLGATTRYRAQLVSCTGNGCCN